jgi:hypothetical protein
VCICTWIHVIRIRIDPTHIDDLALLIHLFSPYPFPFISEREGDSNSEEEGESYSFESYQTPSPIDRKWSRVKQPNPDYISEDQNFPRRSYRQLIFDSEEQPEAVPLDVVTSLKSRKVWKSRQRKKNKLHASIFAITEVDQYGKPTEPKGINAKWLNDCKTLVRENVWITYEHWHLVPTEKKNELWCLLRLNIGHNHLKL